MMNLPVGRQAMKLVKEKMPQISHGRTEMHGKNNTDPAYK